MCWRSAACAGGRPSIALPFCVNSYFLAPLTNSWLLVRSYSRTTNRSSGLSAGYLNRDIPVPWNESCEVVELGLWSMLSIAVVKRPPLSCGGHTAGGIS